MKIIVHFKGGLGNQLIQYAFVQKFLMKEQAEVIFDTSHFYFLGERKFHLGGFHQTRISKWRTIGILFLMYFRIVYKALHKSGLLPYSKRVLGNYVDDDFDFTSLDRLQSGYLFVNGYFQHLEVFPLPGNNVLQLGLGGLASTLANNETYQLIHRLPNPIMLHLRRGDYVSNEVVKKNMGSCGLDYYRRGIELLGRKIGTYSLVVFSDDIDYAAEMFRGFDNIHFVKGDTLDPIHDFLLMRCFKHAVIPNSTLSFVASMLSMHEDNIVVVPEPWYENGQKFLLGMKEEWKYVPKYQ